MNILDISSSREESASRVKNARTEIGKVTYDAYTTCMNCKHSMISFLNTYLISRNIEPNCIQSVSVLLDQCKKVDHTFSDIDLSSINCKYERINEDHCTDRNKLENCIQVTTSIMKVTSLD